MYSSHTWKLEASLHCCITNKLFRCYRLWNHIYCEISIHYWFAREIMYVALVSPHCPPFSSQLFVLLTLGIVTRENWNLWSTGDLLGLEKEVLQFSSNHFGFYSSLIGNMESDCCFWHSERKTFFEMLN